MSSNFKKFKVLYKKVTGQYLLLYVIVRTILFSLTLSSCITVLFALPHATIYHIEYGCKWASNITYTKCSGLRNFEFYIQARRFLQIFGGVQFNNQSFFGKILRIFFSLFVHRNSAYDAVFVFRWYAIEEMSVQYFGKKNERKNPPRSQK